MMEFPKAAKLAALGNSSGGAIALGYAECFLAYVSELVLVDITHKIHCNN